ncbi:4Fe-4S binding protein [candidate division FCPU426 bacterium]|nr:4Fe-4S binding protein [candidate division FCPU426 bacterium]
MFQLPMLPRVLKQLFNRPATNPFPAVHLPKTMTGFLHQVATGKAKMHPPVEVPEGFRGKIGYHSEGCTYCGMCAKVCPARAIDVSRENKCMTVYAGHCIQCAQCTEVCPKGNLFMTKEFLTATTDRYAQDMVLE